jgi:ATP-dependent Zn protease
MDHIDNNPFRSIKAYEVGWDFDYDSKNKSKRIYPDIKTNTINGSLIISSSYKTILQSFSSIVFELSPNYNISYLKAIYKVEYEDESTENKTMENETMENETMENDTKGNDKENEKNEENKGEDVSKKSHNVFIYILVGLVSLILIITIVFIIKRINKSKIQELFILKTIYFFN